MKRLFVILLILISVQTAHATHLRAPTDFKMHYATTIDSLVVYVKPPWLAPACDSMYVANASDSSWVKNFPDSLATDLRIGGLTPDTEYTWVAIVDSSGVRLVS